ncbi:MAG: hypothetical protein ACXIU7_08820 [Roseinatronobacter sp.]
MSRMDYFRQDGTPFDGFLYAILGQDRAGNTVSVLSALARLGRDPWDEAAELSALSSAAAQSRLEGLMARFSDVPVDARDPRATIAQLVALLPQAPAAKLRAGNVLPAGVRLPGIGPLIAFAVLVLFWVQTFILGSDGSGD